MSTAAPSSTSNPSNGKPAETSSFKSGLAEGKQRFLAHVIEHGLEVERRTASDFIRHFPPEKIMHGLRNRPALRASILVLTTGLKRKIALKKSAESAGEDLQIALDEGETDAESIVALFEPDDRVRYLSNKDVWNYVVEGEFWGASPSDKEDLARARAHIVFMINRALEDELLTHRQIVDGITVEELAQRLPKADLGKLIRMALDNAKDERSFTERDLLETMPTESLVNYVPLTHIWERVVVPCIAEPCGFVKRAETEAVTGPASLKAPASAAGSAASAPKSPPSKADTSAKADAPAKSEKTWGALKAPPPPPAGRKHPAPTKNDGAAPETAEEDAMFDDDGFGDLVEAAPESVPPESVQPQSVQTDELEAEADSDVVDDDDIKII